MSDDDPRFCPRDCFCAGMNYRDECKWPEEMARRRRRAEEEYEARRRPPVVEPRGSVVKSRGWDW